MNGAPQVYLRRCNGWPREGREVDRATVEHALAHAQAVRGVTSVGIFGDLDTGLTIRIPAGRPWEVETPGTVPRAFTYEPVPAGQHRAPNGLP